MRHRDTPRMSENTSATTPHDAFFRSVMSQPEAARDFLTFHLPEELRAVCDLDTLQLASGSFITDDLKPFFSDILWSLQTTGGAGYVFALIEHQSKPDRHIAFRMLRYSIAVMQRHLEAGHRTLPLVIPLLFYAGRRSPYPYSTNWLDDFDKPELAAALYGGDFPLVDITVVPDGEIRQHRRVALLEFLHKNIICRDLMEMADGLSELLVSQLNSGYTTRSQLLAALNYAVHAGDTGDYHLFIRTLAGRLPEHGEVLMTVAQRLRQEGHEEGRVEGRMEGRMEGEREKALQIAENMLKCGMDRESVMKMTGLSVEDLADILH